ncbi:MAG: glycosyltransferase family 4 protein [Parachlamydiales bacterium]|jgi:UDP-glucose:(heptosyl)LPS alpha-1,3-glucosyltransferase
MTEIVLTKFHITKFGGLEKHSFFIIKSLIDKGFKITILTTKISDDFKNHDLKVVILKNHKIFNFLKLKIFDLLCKKWIKKNNPKIILSFDRSSNYTHIRLGIGLHLTFLKQKKFFESKFKLFMNRFNPGNAINLSIEKSGFHQKNLKKIIVNSYMVKDELINNYKILDSKIEVIHNGVEFDELKADFDIWDVKKPLLLEKHHLNPDNFHFLFIGNDYKRKGLIPLLNALSLLKNEKFHLSVIGKDKKIVKYKRLSKSLGLEKQVSFFGKQDSVRDFYQIADALVLPSFYDPFSNVAIEALAMGVFVITSEFNGAKEILNAQNGKVTDIMNLAIFSNELKNAMKTKKSKDRAIKIRDSIKDLTIEKQIDKLIQTISV